MLTETIIDHSHGLIKDGPTSYKDEDLKTVELTEYLPMTLLARDSTDNKMAPFAVGGSNGLDNPVAIAVKGFTTIAGEVEKRYRVLNCGVVDFRKLVVHLDGDNSSVTEVLRDKLRANGIDAVDTGDI